MKREFNYNLLRASKIRYTRLLRVAMRYAQLQAYMAWYSTLGGAHSSLGDRFGVHVSNLLIATYQLYNCCVMNSK